MFETAWRYEKDVARKLATCNIVDAPAAQCAIFLPAVDYRCCLAAAENGLINEKTFMIIVERDMNVMPMVQKRYRELVKAGKLSTAVMFYPNALHRLDLSQINRPISYGFLDWYDELTATNLGFVAHSLAPQLSDNSDVAFTFCLNEWTNKFAKSFEIFLGSTIAKGLMAECKRIWSFSPSRKATKVLAALRLAFHNYEFDCCHDPYIYHDTAKVMLYVRLNRIHRNTTSPLSLDLVHAFEDLIDQHSKRDTVWSGRRSTAGAPPKGDRSADNRRKLEMIRYEKDLLLRRMQEDAEQLRTLERREKSLVRGKNTNRRKMS